MKAESGMMGTKTAISGSDVNYHRDKLLRGCPTTHFLRTPGVSIPPHVREAQGFMENRYWFFYNK